MMPLTDYTEIVLMGESDHLSDEDLLRLYITCTTSQDSNIVYEACKSLVVQKSCSLGYILQMLDSTDERLAKDTLDNLRFHVGSWALPLLPSVSRFLESTDVDMKSYSMLIIAQVTQDHLDYGLYLCQVAMDHPDSRFIAMNALSYICPAPAGVRSELLKLMKRYAFDKEFLIAVKTRLAEL